MLLFLSDVIICSDDPDDDVRSVIVVLRDAPNMTWRPSFSDVTISK